MTTLDGVTKKKQAEVLTVGLHRVLGRLARRAVNQKIGEPLRCRDHVVATPVRILTSVEFPRFPEARRSSISVQYNRPRVRTSTT